MKTNNFFSHANKKHLIGVIHFPPLLGLADAPSMDIAEKNALTDLQSFQEGGADAVIIENNYDLPHLVRVGPGTVAAMTLLGSKVRTATNLPIGVCVLWNDYEASFAIAKAIGAQFIRVPVFIDHVETDFGTIVGDPVAVLAARKNLGAQDIGLIVDIHVKHAKILSGTTIAEAAKAAITAGADGIIVTGGWTGKRPDETDLAAVRESVPEALVLAGSGVSKENTKEILTYADGAIVSTSLKEGYAVANERNVKAWDQRIDKGKVSELAGEFQL